MLIHEEKTRMFLEGALDLQVKIGLITQRIIGRSFHHGLWKSMRHAASAVIICDKMMIYPTVATVADAKFIQIV